MQITATKSLLLWYLKCLFPSSLLIFPIPSTVSRRSRWGILINFFLLYQIGMVQPVYARPRICNLGIIHIFDSFVRGCLDYLVSLATSFQEYRYYDSFLFQAKSGPS